MPKPTNKTVRFDKKNPSAPPRVHRLFEGRRNKNAISVFPTADALLMILRRYLSPSESDDGRMVGSLGLMTRPKVKSQKQLNRLGYKVTVAVTSMKNEEAKFNAQ